MGLFLEIFHTIFISLVELLELLGIIIVIGFLLGFMERYSRQYWVKALGPWGIMLTACIGTPIHELGHLIMCFLFGHKVSRIKLLQLHSPDGVLGYVEHRYNPNSLYQQAGNFFIGVGPIFSGIGSLILAMYWLVPQSYEALQSQISSYVSLDNWYAGVFKMMGGAIWSIGKSLFTLQNVISPYFWLFLILGIAISSHIALSRADIQNSTKGLLIIFFLLVLLNIAAGLLGFNSMKLITRLAEYNAYMIAFSSIAILFSLITYIIGYLIFKTKGRLISKRR